MRLQVKAEVSKSTGDCIAVALFETGCVLLSYVHFVIIPYGILSLLAHLKALSARHYAKLIKANKRPICAFKIL
jgi:hypothetical protein